jgi:hypothetical protein
VAEDDQVQAQDEDDDFAYLAIENVNTKDTLTENLLIETPDVVDPTNMDLALNNLLRQPRRPQRHDAHRPVGALRQGAPGLWRLRAQVGPLRRAIGGYLY